MKIQGIILDVDGVIIGEKIGYNSPYPNLEVINKLKELRMAGIPISLCTAKPHFSIWKIINDAKLDNFHIADGGGVIINPINRKIVKQHILDKVLVKLILETFINNEVYTEIYTVDNYFIQRSQECEITKKHNHVLQAEPILLDDIVSESVKLDVTKIMPIAVDAEEDTKRVEKIFNNIRNRT